MVRRPEGWSVEQSAVGQRAAGRGVDAGDGERLLGGEGREQARHPLGQHGLAGAGRADHEEMVTPRRGHFERPAPYSLAPHVGQIRDARGSMGSRGGRRVGPPSLAPQGLGQVPKRRRAAHLPATDQRGLTHVAQRDHQPERRRGVGQGDHARDVPERPVQPELAAEGQALGATRGQLTRGDEQADGDRQVEPRSPFAHAGWREVDCDSSQRPGETGREDGGTDPVPRLANGCVREPDNGESRKSVRDVDLHRDRAPDGTTQRRGGDCGEHAGERSHWRSARARTVSRSFAKIDSRCLVSPSCTLGRVPAEGQLVPLGTNLDRGTRSGLLDSHFLPEAERSITGARGSPCTARNEHRSGARIADYPV